MYSTYVHHEVKEIANRNSKCQKDIGLLQGTEVVINTFEFTLLL